MLPQSSVISVAEEKSRRIGYVSIGAIARRHRSACGLASPLLLSRVVQGDFHAAGRSNGESNWGGDPDGGLAGDESDAMNFGLDKERRNVMNNRNSIFKLYSRLAALAFRVILLRQTSPANENQSVRPVEQPVVVDAHGDTLGSVVALNGRP